MRRTALVLAVVVGAAGLAEAGRLPKPMSLVKRQKIEARPTAALHKDRGEKPQRRSQEKTAADAERAKRLTHRIRE